MNIWFYLDTFNQLFSERLQPHCLKQFKFYLNVVESISYLVDLKKISVMS